MHKWSDLLVANIMIHVVLVPPAVAPRSCGRSCVARPFSERSRYVASRELHAKVTDLSRDIHMWPTLLLLSVTFHVVRYFYLVRDFVRYFAASSRSLLITCLPLRVRVRYVFMASYGVGAPFPLCAPVYGDPRCIKFAKILVCAKIMYYRGSSGCIA